METLLNEKRKGIKEESKKINISLLRKVKTNWKLVTSLKVMKKVRVLTLGMVLTLAQTTMTWTYQLG